MQGVCQTQKGGCSAGLRGKSSIQCAWRQEQLLIQMGSSSYVQDLCLTFTSLVRDFEWRMKLGFIWQIRRDCFQGGWCKNGQDEDIRLLSRVVKKGPQLWRWRKKIIIVDTILDTGEKIRLRFLQLDEFWSLNSLERGQGLGEVLGKERVHL